MPEDESTCHVLRLQKAKANLAELELEKLRGSVIPVELVEIFGTTLVTITKNRFLGVPSRLRNEFPDVSQALFNRLDDLIRESLEELGTTEFRRKTESIRNPVLTDIVPHHGNFKRYIDLPDFPKSEMVGVMSNSPAPRSSRKPRFRELRLTGTSRRSPISKVSSGERRTPAMAAVTTA